MNNALNKMVMILTTTAAGVTGTRVLDQGRLNITTNITTPLFYNVAGVIQ